MNTNTEISHECGDGCDLGLESFNEFNKLYESRLERIDREANFCDNIKLKYEILKEWIRDLIEQNRCLIETLQELQTESSNRVSLLEYKLKNDEEKFGNNNRFGQLESDLKNVLELLRRAREDREWNATGLTFKTISYEDLFGQKPVSTAVNPHAIPENIPSDSSISNTSIAGDSHFQTAIGTLKELLNEKDTKLNSCLKDNLKLINMNKSLELKLSEMAKNSSQSDKMVNNSHVLALEVAEKHDIIMRHRTDILQLEERLRHADKQIQFKDDVIRELRRDCRKLVKCPSPNYNILQQIEQNNTDMRKSNDNTEPANCELELSHRNSERNNTIPLIANTTECDRERSRLLEQLQCRESHILSQNSIITNYHQKNNELRLKSAELRSKRNEAVKKFQVLENELSKLKIISNSTMNDSSTLPPFNSTLNESDIPSSECGTSNIEAHDDSSFGVLNTLKEVLSNLRTDYVNLKEENTKLQQELSTVKTANEKCSEEIERIRASSANNVTGTNASKRNSIVKTAGENSSSNVCHLNNEKCVFRCAVRNFLQHLAYNRRNSMDVAILCDQLSDYFEDNMKKEKQLVFLKDENLDLKYNLYEMQHDYEYLKEKIKYYTISMAIPEDLRNNGCPGLNRDLNQLQKNHTANKIEYKTSRRNDCKELNKCDKCSEMESLCNKKLDMQQIKYTEIINELSDELNSLSEQLAASQQESLHQEDPMKALEATIVQIEEQNDILQETIQETESRLTNAEYQIGALTFENEQLQLEVHNYRKQLDERQLASNQSQTNKTESDDYHIQISQWRCKVLTLEKALAAKTKDNERLAHQWRDIQQRQTEMQEELYAKKSRVAYLEKEEHRLQESINILSGEIAANKNQHRHRDEDVRRIKIQVEEQTAVILKQRSQNDNLSRENERLRSTRDTLYRDIEAYKSENCNLKGQVSVFQEQENAVQDLLAETQEQLAVEKEEHNRLQGLSATLNKCKANCSRISSNNAELLQKCQMFQTEYENLMCEYQKLLEVKEQALVALNTARQWQSEQDNREKLFAKKLSKNAEHIDTLMADRETLIKKIYDMHRSEVILHNDLDQLRERIQSGSSPNFSGAANNCNVDRYASDSELDYQSNQVYQRAKCVTRKMNRTRKIYQNGLRDVAK